MGSDQLWDSKPERTAGHQNKIPATKKLACSKAWQNGDLRASSKIAGTCQIITVRLPASQETTRLGRQCRRNDEPTPSRTNGAATSIRSKCWTIWAVKR